MPLGATANRAGTEVSFENKFSLEMHYPEASVEITAVARWTRPSTPGSHPKAAQHLAY